MKHIAEIVSDVMRNLADKPTTPQEVAQQIRKEHQLDVADKHQEALERLAGVFIKQQGK